MARPYSVDLRELAVARAEAGETVREVAEGLGISASCVAKWMKRKRETGGVLPGKMGGHRKRRLSGEIATWLERRLSGGPFTLKGLVEELGERGVATGVRAVWVFVHDHKLSFKKNRARQRADAPRHRP
jgi:putative transposase